MQEIAVKFVYAIKTRRWFNSLPKYISSFDNIYVIIVCCEDSYGRYSIQRRNDVYFYP